MSKDHRWAAGLSGFQPLAKIFARGYGLADLLIIVASSATGASMSSISIAMAS
jgi:hypothetical protein